MWSLNSRRALLFLKAVLPFLRMKKRQAEIAIAFQESKRMGGRPTVLTPQILELRDRQRHEITHLNNFDHSRVA
jgi:hypothetical protein